MCAINGFTFEDRALVEAMNRATAHRGPDGTGLWVGEGLSLGHNRLAIIDVSPAGAQPMESTHGSVIVFNGEIYNFEALRKELLDYPYRGRSDTEVILASYERWGVEAFNRLNGMFAFALLDRSSQELFLVRDRAGIKPLYYYFDGRKLIFSSEIKALLEHDIPRVLDQENFPHYLRLGYVPGPGTLFRNIRKLLPGHLLSYKEGVMKIKPFVSEESRASEGVADEELKSVVVRAVQRQLVSDRPIGIYLSGGFDSSIVLAAATEAHGAIDTFSVGFDLGNHPRTAFFNADVELARKTAGHFGSRHHEIMLGQEDIAPTFENMIWHMDEPVANATSLPMLHLARYAKEKVAVALGGDGGDELFGGYERYRLSLLASRYRLLPDSARALLDCLHGNARKLDTPSGVRRFGQFMFQKDAELSRVLAAPYDLEATSRLFEEMFFTPLDKNFERQFMDTDRRSWLVDECLVRTDKMAMASGLEIRVPFLDNEVISCASRIPTSEKVSLRGTKRMLKRAFRDMLPHHLYGEKKRGWFSPGGEWIKTGAFAKLADETLTPSYCEETAALFRWNEIRTMLERHRRGEEYHMVMLWSLLVFQVWMKKFSVRIW